MKQTYQHGYLRRSKRKTSADQWEFLWRERDESGVMRRRTAILGTIEKYLDERAAQAAANGAHQRGYLAPTPNTYSDQRFDRSLHRN